jgi:hypothetical protein
VCRRQGLLLQVLLLQVLLRWRVAVVAVVDKSPHGAVARLLLRLLLLRRSGIAPQVNVARVGVVVVV